MSELQGLIVAAHGRHYLAHADGKALQCVTRGKKSDVATGDRVRLTATSPADGYTVVVSSPTIAISPSLYKKLSYNATKDLAPVARLAAIENVMVVHPSVPAKTLKQFIELARSKPGVLNYGSGGAGTTNHLANELLKYLEKINVVHVPYKGGAPLITALLAGEVQSSMDV
jgi:tripartite-type tricarboxylate transporter receptor subunit TctC